MAGLGQMVELIVVDDGSSQTEAAAVTLLVADLRSTGASVREIRQEPRGPAAARNHGIDACTGDLILFLGDDIVPCPGLLQTHLDVHRQSGADERIAVLGMADLAPDLCQTPFARWWRRWNFRYNDLLTGKRRPDCTFFFTNNLSVKRHFLLRHGGFDEAFPAAAYEDIELGWRLSQDGLTLLFAPQAKAHHVHAIDLNVACRRMEVRGRYYDLFRSKTPLPAISRVWNALGNGPWMQPSLIRPLWQWADRLQSRLDLGPIYILVLMYYFLVGRGLRPPFATQS
jgi:GT2 family glycosyltransferase